jgi:hypothetical protein
MFQILQPHMVHNMENFTVEVMTNILVYAQNSVHRLPKVI